MSFVAVVAADPALSWWSQVSGKMFPLERAVTGDASWTSRR